MRPEKGTFSYRGGQESVRAHSAALGGAGRRSGPAAAAHEERPEGGSRASPAAVERIADHVVRLGIGDGA